MYDPRIILMAKILAPFGFLSCLTCIPLIVYAYVRDINLGLSPSLAGAVIAELFFFIMLIWIWWYMTKKWGWFQGKSK